MDTVCKHWVLVLGILDVRLQQSSTALTAGDLGDPRSLFMFWQELSIFKDLLVLHLRSDFQHFPQGEKEDQASPNRLPAILQ